MWRSNAVRRAAAPLQQLPATAAAAAAAAGLLPTAIQGSGDYHRVSSYYSSSRDPPLTTTRFFAPITVTTLSPLGFVAPFSTATDSSNPSALPRDRDETEGEEWEEEEDVEPVIGDGGDGGGVVLADVEWGERVLAEAREVLWQCGDDLAMFGFKVSSKGYIYVRLDKLTNNYGCPSMEEIEKFNNLYKKRLDEIGESGEIPDLAIEVSSPGAERLLKVPEDLDRFKELPMKVQYLEEGDISSKHNQLREKVLLLESVNDTNPGHCVWKLADVKENRADLGKGRPLSRKQKDWRLRLPFVSVKRVMMFLD